MRLRCFPWGVGLALILMGLPHASHAQSMRKAERAIEQAWEQQTTLRATLRVSAVVQAGPNQLSVKGEGTVEMRREGDVEQWRQSLTTKLPEPVGAESHHDAIFDGKSLYLVNEMMGQRDARVVPPNIGRGIAPPGGKPLLKTLEENLDLQLLREDTIGERAVYVIEGTPRATDGPFDKALFFIDQNTGLQLRQEVYSGDELSPRVVIACEDVTTGVELGPDRFKLGAEQSPTPEAPTESAE